MRSLSLALLGGALSAFAFPATPGECQPSSSLSFAYQPTIAKGLSARVIYNNLTAPRGLRFDQDVNLLVVERGKGIVALTERNDATCAGWEKRTVITQSDLEHGIEVGPIPGNKDKQYLYASSQERVYRWEYDPKNAAIIGNPTIIAFNMSNSDHVTRTLLLQPGKNGESEYLIVSRGSASNFDESSADVNAGPAQIRRFPLTKSDRPAGGYSWNQGTVLAWGVRNGVGIALSKDGKDLWEIENSSDNIRWRDVDIHIDNPSEELNRISLREPEKIPIENKFYGYPSCFTAWNSSSVPRNESQPVFDLPTGAQFSRRPVGTQPDDAWCQNPNNNKPPRLSFQAHSAPLDLVFYDNSKCSPRDNNVGIPRKWDGDAFTSFHGSWNRQPPTGYSVVRIPWAGDAPRAPASSFNGYEHIVYAPDLTKCPSECIRPVGLAFGKKGQLMVASDETGEVFVIEGKKA
ncbi:hypothetical protein RhiXN_11826 [Rhizoctonia solani]|uniref:Pyrroloquinoline quinone-dependent pyranose dehydrogenase beta-propeller domain-containing protein n=1 Tax=Rhizoctonia solani TaxID=456999 RepID=A0A8H8T0N5_9AGAM|nr:uncharacterized protein RhiXN_11826 [Rhizoctonia solani]QRW24914.1 hypothetical protein RhiXN_11826 [Rhizoctonia solani]